LLSLDEDEEGDGDDVGAEADGVGLAVAVESPLPPVKTSLIASPIESSRFPLVADGDGVAVAVPPPPDDDVSDEPDEGVADGSGVALSAEPESDEEVLPEDESCAAADAVGVGVAVSLAGVDSLAEAEGVGVAEGSLDASRALTQSLYSSAVRLFDVGGVVVELPSASARLDVKPMPMSTAVGIATVAIALPAGMWNLVNSGFLGAAWRGPDLTRDSSTSAPWITLSAGTVPPVRPVGRARS
jgi:hypothetical protein